MLLSALKEENSWILSRWNLTYESDWAGFLKGIISVYDKYQDFEIIVDGNEYAVTDEASIKAIPEGKNITFRGISTVLKVPVMVTFYTGHQAVDVNVAKATYDLFECTYENVNMSLGQYMDGIEIAMFR